MKTNLKQRAASVFLSLLMVLAFIPFFGAQEAWAETELRDNLNILLYNGTQSMSMHDGWQANELLYAMSDRGTGDLIDMVDNYSQGGVSWYKYDMDREGSVDLIVTMYDETQVVLMDIAETCSYKGVWTQQAPQDFIDYIAGEPEIQYVYKSLSLYFEESLPPPALSIDGAKVTLSKTTYTYNGKVQKPSILKIDGMALTEGTDYTAVWSNESSKNAGTYTVTITGKGNYIGQTKATYKINKKAVTPTVTLSKTAFVYNGKTQKPTVTVKAGSTTLKSSSYTLTNAGRKTVGKGTVKVTLKGNYSGTKTVTYKINPKGTSIASVTAASKGFTVKWKKQATQTTGYQIYYSTSSTAPKATTTPKATIKSTSTLSKKVTGLKGGKKYYVYVRTYKTVNDVKYYSAWSKARTVTTKK